MYRMMGWKSTSNIFRYLLKKWDIHDHLQRGLAQGSQGIARTTMLAVVLFFAGS